MPPKDSIANTLLVSIALCVVCSLVVSSAAVALKPLQERNRLIDRWRNIIEVAKLAEDPSALSAKEVREIFNSRVERRLVDLGTGEYVEDAPENFEPRQAAKDPESNEAVEGPFNIGIAKRESKTWVYLIKDDAGGLEQVVLPIYGMGLWSTLYGYVALEDDFRTIRGLTYYEHAETPGLGGEVENPIWKSKWNGIQVWEEDADRADQNLRVGVVKGSPSDNEEPYKVDGLSGATITSRGVDSMMKYWFSDDAFGPYIRKLASQQGASDGKSNS